MACSVDGVSAPPPDPVDELEECPYRTDRTAASKFAALPLADWLRVTVTPLAVHPNDPATAR